jgi:protocatechuate 3,4-dioxygenase beta subunit
MRRRGKSRKGRLLRRLAAAGCLFALIQAGLSVPAGSGADPCVPTAEDAEGPFYKPGAPERSSTGSGLAVSGVVRSFPGCRPVPGARVEWWHADHSGRYVDSLRGMQMAGDAGGYAFTTSFPGIYPGRPPHIHIKVFAPGHRPLTTQLHLRGGEKSVRFNPVLGTERTRPAGPR